MTAEIKQDEQTASIGEVSISSLQETTKDAIINNCNVGLVLLDADQIILEWNDWIANHSSISADTALGQCFGTLFPNLENSKLSKAINAAISSDLYTEISNIPDNQALPLTDDHNLPVSQHITAKPVTVIGSSTLCLLQVTDISRAVKRERQLVDQSNIMEELAEKISQEKERSQVTLESIADAVITTDAEGHVHSMNKVAVKLTGWPLEKALNRPVSQIFSVIHEITRTRTPNPVAECLQHQKAITNDQDLILIDHHGGEYAITESAAPIRGGDGEQLGAVLVFRDVTSARKLSSQLNWQAAHDPLTGLLNRREFEHQLKRLLETAQHGTKTHSLMYLDLDQFKVVNDTCGHSAGDELLRQLTSLIVKLLRNDDILARLGGDEFGILLEGCQQADALRVANLLRLEIQKFRFGWQGKTFSVGVSIGLTQISGEIVDPDEIMSAADSACYAAKENGRNRVHIHEVGVHKRSIHQKEMQWVHRIQSALDDNRFELFVQPIISLSKPSEGSDHYEVLIRMVEPDCPLISPGAFIPAAERFNLMPKIDRWVVKKVAGIISDLAASGANNVPLFSINLSGTSFSDDSFVDDVLAMLREHKISANTLCFEITETAMIANMTKAVNFVNELKSAGCYLSLDDFGSGLSSFTYLKNFPVDFLKIDGYFVKDICHDPIDYAFVESINQIGHVMGITTIAEFVENELILEAVKTIGVDCVQGFGVKQPFEFSTLIESLKR